MANNSDNTNLPGVFCARKKDNSIYYRASVTFNNKHISLGSYDCAEDASAAYEDAKECISDSSVTIESYSPDRHIVFEKWVILCNFRDNGVYIKTPVYVRPRMFYYYFAPDDFLIFSSEDLFYYSAHKIQRRGGHLFVADYGSQINILSRYGIRSHAVPGRDYVFVNGNAQDMQYSNIQVINSYYGVNKTPEGKYLTRILVNGYIKVGVYDSAIEAAIAYNKAADIVLSAGIIRNYPTNYFDGLSAKAYADISTSVHISRNLKSVLS